MAVCHPGRVVAQSVQRVRNSRDSPDYSKYKSSLQCVAFSGAFSEGRKGKFPSPASGLVFLEVDSHDGPPPSGWLEGEKARLAAHPAVVAVYTSVGGQGLHAVLAVDPIPVDRPSYRQAWAWATRELALEDRGDPLVKDSTRLACISHDPALYINLTPHALALGAEHAGSSTARNRTGQYEAAHHRLT